MKRALIVTLALGFLVPALAFAQENGRDEGKRPGHERPEGKPNRPAPGHPEHRPPEHKPPEHRPPQHRATEHRPPEHRPPEHRPPAEHHYRPRAHEYYHGGHWSARMHVSPFVYPHGWHYRQWSIGARLPGIFLAPSYFYSDYVALGLQAPPPGFAWVRFGPDLLLVNLQTGAIIDVAYGVFY